MLYDDKRAYVEFFPRWHSFLGQEGLGSKILAASITWQAWAAQLTVLLASNHYFAVFFVLPSMTNPNHNPNPNLNPGANPNPNPN